MPRARNKKRTEIFGELAELLGNRLKPPFGVVLGSPAEVAELLTRVPGGATTCYQMDLFQADRLTAALQERGVVAQVQAHADLWDLPAGVQTLLYPVPLGGERALKLDMVEQAF